MQKTFITTFKDCQDWFDKRDFPALAFDTETDGLKYNSPVIGMSFCDGEKACYINLYNNADEDLIVKLLDAVLDFTDLLIGHNLKYDLKVLKSCEIEPECNLYDTMVAAHLLNETKPCGLKSLMKRKLHYKDVKEWKEVKDKGYDSPEFQEYGITDAIATWQMYELTKPLIEKNGFHDLFYNIEMPFQRVLVDLETNGIEIDQDYLEDLDDTLAAEKVILEQKCVESLGLKMIREKNLFGFVTVSSPANFNSSKQLIKIIKGLGLKLPYKTEKGTESTKKEALKTLVGKHPFIDLLLEWRKVEKLHNTFVSPMWNHIYSDGRIRTNFNDCGTLTGRLSSDSPNLQNLPKNSKTDTYKIRGMFVPKKGYKLVHADFSGQELRVCAVESKDKNLIDFLEKNKDLHLSIVNDWFNLGIPEEALYESHKDYEYYKEKFIDIRDKLKISFPILYGTTSFGISWRTGIKEDEAQKGIDSFFRLFPDVQKRMEECKQQLYKNKHLVTMLGRKRRFWELSPKAFRQAFNFLIQGYCADLLRIAMVLLRREYLNHPEWDAKLVLTVHDSVDTEIKEEYAEVCAKRKKEIMEGCSGLIIPLPVVIKILDRLE